MLSISIGVIGALGLIIRELRNAPTGYESEDGFHIADNLSKAGWSWGCVSAVDSHGERSGLLTRIAGKSAFRCARG
ncbi:MAG TPA: hypothetical protein VGY75_01665 [Candidatus Udaeobacter sp.]|nr:hypothetical protein [Candidatus Udaeobacter sp.]